jgi:acyl carrier protein
MRNPDLETRVKEILTNRLGMPMSGIMNEARLVEDLGMDSLDATELAIGLERQFGVAISDEEIAKLVTVSDIVRLVERLAPEREGSA